ncbi:MAG: glycosyltransferase family 4 protein [Prevotellaceae bacterium]|nr:glycosyltransferase family 4 protein [Prevotellaceae bacterium]
MTTNKKIIRAVTVPGSLGFCRDIMIKMREKSYEMIAVSSPGEQLDELRDKDGFATYAVPMARHISLFGDIKSLFRMIKVFRKERPQMVHSLTPKAGLICMMAAWLTRVPVRVHMFTGLVWPTSKGLKRKILMATDWLTCACATHVLPEGQGVMNDLKNGHITKKPMKVLGYGNVVGIDLERFDPERFPNPSSLTPHPYTFVFVGRITGDKGINELVEAFVKLNEKHPDTRLVLVGRYESELDPLKPETLQKIESCKAIDACGPKYGDDLLMEYLKSDCFIMPSYREGFPNTVIEAGAMGLPSIVTDINGSREIIVDGENGLIVSPQTVQPLYEAMERMMNDKELREKMHQNARPMIASRFEKNFVQGCLMEFYDEVLLDD